MANRDTLTRSARSVLAAVVGALALATSADAVNTTSTPNAAFFTYNLAPASSSPNYTPPAGVSVSVMANCTSTPFSGVGQVALLRFPGQYVQWVGLNSYPNGTITQGISGTTGVDILQIDGEGKVWLEVGSVSAAGSSNRDTLRIHNSSPEPRAGNMTWNW